MLLLLIASGWLAVVVFALTLCAMAGRAERDARSLGTDAHEADSIQPPLVVIRIPGDTADAAHGARGHLPSSVLAPPAGVS